MRHGLCWLLRSLRIVGLVGSITISVFSILFGFLSLSRVSGPLVACSTVSTLRSSTFLYPRLSSSYG